MAQHLIVSVILFFILCCPELPSTTIINATSVSALAQSISPTAQSIISTALFQLVQESSGWSYESLKHFRHISPKTKLWYRSSSFFLVSNRINKAAEVQDSQHQEIQDSQDVQGFVDLLRAWKTNLFRLQSSASSASLSWSTTTLFHLQNTTEFAVDDESIFADTDGFRSGAAAFQIWRVYRSILKCRFGELQNRLSFIVVLDLPCDWKTKLSRTSVLRYNVLGFSSRSSSADPTDLSLLSSDHSPFDSTDKDPTFKCFSVSDMKKKVMAGLCKNGEKEGQTCCHLGLMEDALVLLQTGKRLVSAAFRKESVRWSAEGKVLQTVEIAHKLFDCEISLYTIFRLTAFCTESMEAMELCFIEFNTLQEAELAKERTHGYRLDKAHTFAVHLFDDFDKFMKVPDEWALLGIKPYTPGENLQQWLTDEKARGQLVICARSDTEVLWNDPSQLSCWWC